MKKDAYYFSHDANAQDDFKCIRLIDVLGMEGYGIFWALIERLRAENDYKLPLDCTGGLAKRWGTSKEKVDAVILNFNLFIVQSDLFFSNRLLRSMDEYKTRKIHLSESGKKGNLIRWGSQPDRNPIALKEKKVNIKVNEIKSKYLDFVTLTQSEYESLIQAYGETQTKDMILRLNDWIGSKGNKYRSHYHTIKNWFRRDGLWQNGGHRLSRAGEDKLRILENSRALEMAAKEGVKNAI